MFLKQTQLAPIKIDPGLLAWSFAARRGRSHGLRKEINRPFFSVSFFRFCFFNKKKHELRVEQVMPMFSHNEVGRYGKKITWSRPLDFEAQLEGPNEEKKHVWCAQMTLGVDEKQHCLGFSVERIESGHQLFSVLSILVGNPPPKKVGKRAPSWGTPQLHHVLESLAGSLDFRRNQKPWVLYVRHLPAWERDGFGESPRVGLSFRGVPALREVENPPSQKHRALCVKTKTTKKTDEQPLGVGEPLVFNLATFSGLTLGLGSKTKNLFFSSCVVGFQPLNHNKQTCKGKNNVSQQPCLGCSTCFHFDRIFIQQLPSPKHGLK